MKYLGFDLGTKTLGIAISDEQGILARTYQTLTFSSEDYLQLLPKIKEIIEKEKISGIVLGLPKNMNNSLGFAAERSLEFKQILEKNITIPIYLQDERLSTREAENYMIQGNISRKKRKKKIDSLAANIILQTFLDRKGENNGRKNDI